MITVQTNTTIVLPFYTELINLVPVVGDTYLFKFVDKWTKTVSEEIAFICTVNTGYICKFEGDEPTTIKNDSDIYIDGLNTKEILRILTLKKFYVY